MMVYLGCAIVGYIIGNKWKSKLARIGWFGLVQTIALMCLVFSMGLRVGANEEVISQLGSIGLYAFLMTLAILAGSLFCVSVTRRLLGIDRYGKVRGGKAVPSIEPAAESHSEDMDEPAAKFDKMMLYILGMVIIGMAAGFFLMEGAPGMVEICVEIASWTIRAGLCIMIFLIGVDMGIAGTILGDIRRAGLRVLIIPVATAVGTIGSAAGVAWFVGLSLKEGAAIGAGFGWYSLAPGIIMDHGFMVAGAISFMHNVMREVSAILLTPFVARYIGYVECVCLPGAAAMDVCLPIVTRATNDTTAVYSFISGVILSFAVPIMVPLFV